jgi:hypothetical protein
MSAWLTSCVQVGLVRAAEHCDRDFSAAIEVDAFLLGGGGQLPWRPAVGTDGVLSQECIVQLAPVVVGDLSDAKPAAEREVSGGHRLYVTAQYWPDITGRLLGMAVSPAVRVGPLLRPLPTFRHAAMLVAGTDSSPIRVAGASPTRPRRAEGLRPVGALIAVCPCQGSIRPCSPDGIRTRATALRG